MCTNLDWEVHNGSGGDMTRDGGKQRLITRIIIVRKSFFYTLHAFFMAFTISSVAFYAFTVEADDIVTRAFVILTVLLAAVVFINAADDKIPKVPYATTLDRVIITNHMFLMLIAGAVFMFSYIAIQGNANIYNNIYCNFSSCLVIPCCLGTVQ